MVDRVHSRSVPGYENSLPELVRQIFDMRYDEVETFCGLMTAELRRQAEGDRGRNRPQLAATLDQAADTAKQLQVQMGTVWRLCKPHMTDSSGE